MKKLFSKISSKLQGTMREEPTEKGEEEYVELNTEEVGEHEAAKIVVRPFTLEDFSDVKPILDSLREGYTVALVNIKPLKDKDLVELKRAINKLKKTCDAIEGDIAGFGEDYIVIVPAFAEIYRTKQTKKIDEE
ncbi:cell division protein SepF [Candidatus Woesearchaeota archaeon]|nr:MAG: cell division protein SepF [Candidatus Woesearchaeota archaeon]